MLALILACTITTPCIYIEPNPTLPGMSKELTHETPSIPIQSTPTRPTTPSLTPPRGTPTPHDGTQRTQPHQPLAQNVPLSHLRTYIVVSGDCLYSIGLRYGTTWQTLWAHNPGIMDPNLIWPDQVIELP